MLNTGRRWGKKIWEIILLFGVKWVVCQLVGDGVLGVKKAILTRQTTAHNSIFFLLILSVINNDKCSVGTNFFSFLLLYIDCGVLNMSVGWRSWGVPINFLFFFHFIHLLLIHWLWIFLMLFIIMKWSIC